jgi:hypothetical protein
MGVPARRLVADGQGRWEFDPGRQPGLYLWVGGDEGQSAHLRKWEGCDDHQIGYVSRDGLGVHARAYAANALLDKLLTEHVNRQWLNGVDAAEAEELCRTYLLEVWLGEDTPYLVTAAADWAQAVRDWLKRSAHF